MGDNYYIIYRNENSLNGLDLKKIDEITYKKLLNNNYHKNFNYEVLKDKVETEFCVKIDSSNHIINLILISELNQRQLELYLRMNEEEQDNIKEYAEQLSILKYNQVSNNIIKKLNNILSSIDLFWENKENSLLNFNLKFYQRKFNNFNIDDIGFTNFFETKNQEGDYLGNLFKTNNLSLDFTNKSYCISNISKITINEINEIYNELSLEHLQYNFIANLLCYRTCCHLILNNKELLIMAKPIFDKYIILFKYLIGYAWLTFTLEETKKSTRIKDTDRIVFDIDTVYNLPLFPFTYEDINQNPYACVLLDKSNINLANNFVALNPMKNYKKYYGVCNSEEFSRRINIFVNGKNEKGILDKIDWSLCAITGSAMTACGMKYNPLMDICKTHNNEDILTDEDINSYFFHYYNDSDIDLICNHEKTFDFLDTVDKLQKDIESLHGTTNMSSVHTASIVISDELIVYLLEDIKKELNDDTINLENFKKNYSKQEIKNYFYDKYYVPWKYEQKELVISVDKQDNNIYKEHLNYVPKHEFRIYIQNHEIDTEYYKIHDNEKCIYMSNLYELSGYEEKKSNDEDKIVAKLSESLRFKISANGIKTFEIFRTLRQDFISITARFHMGIVRAFWNGKTLKCLPSYITSMMIQISTDYKYFSSLRNPVEILNKYRSRGFGVILNNYEKKQVIYYNSSKNDNKENIWTKIYNINIKNKFSVLNVFGPRNSNDDLFKPSKYIMGLPNDCYKITNHDVCNNFDNAFISINNLLLTDIFRIKAIDDLGHINVLDKDIIEYVWKKINVPNCNRRFLN
jgi:hypothetical protein